MSYLQNLIIPIVKKNRFLFLLIILLLIPQNVLAYIGPGMAISAILVVLGVVVSLFLGLLAVIYYPIKRLIKKVNSKKKYKKKSE